MVYESSKERNFYRGYSKVKEISFMCFLRFYAFFFKSFPFDLVVVCFYHSIIF